MSDEAKLLVRLEASATKMIAEMKKASAVVKQQMATIDAEFTRTNQVATAGLVRKAAAMTQTTAASGAMRASIQNTAFQVGDFAVQVAGGTSATRALAQQLPQLLGGLGVLGAVAGAAAAIAIPLAGNFLFAANEIKKIDAISLEGVRGRLAELKGLQEQYTAALIAAGPAATTSGQQILTAIGIEYEAKLKLLELEAITLQQRKRQLEASVASQQQVVEGIRAEIEARSNLITDDPTNAEFTRTQQQREQLQIVQDVLAENEAVLLEFQRQSAELDLVNLSLAEMGGYISGAIGLAAGLALGFGDVREQAQLAAIAAASIARYDATLAQTGQDSGPDSVRSRQQGGGVFTPVVRGAGLAQPKAKGGRGGGGGGGGKKAEDPGKFLQDRLDTAQLGAELARVEAESILYGAEAATKMKVAFELMSEAKRKGLDLDKVQIASGKTLRAEIDAQAAAIAKLTLEAEHYRERAQLMEDVTGKLQDGFLDAIVSGKDFSGVLKDVAAQLAKAALQAALFGTGPFAGGGGGAGGLLSGLGSLFGGFKERGGDVQSGRAYVVGEKRPELFVPNQSGTIIPRLPAAGGGVSETHVRVSVDQNGNLQAFVQREAGRQARMEGARVAASVPQLMANSQKRRG